jgi:hypothetical protein
MEMEMTKAEQTAIRTHVLNSRDVEKVRITRTGEVHALGTMPNTNHSGWYFVGYVEDVLRDMRREAEFA